MYVPALENNDVMIYLYKSCHWSERRFRNNKSNIKCIQALNQLYHLILNTTYMFNFQYLITHAL